MGKLIVIEGLDGSGKSTQLDLLYKRLTQSGTDCRCVSFPDYESDSSALVKMYLAGKFGNNPNDVNAFAASCFYAADRFASFKTNWGEYYLNGGTIIAGRYTTSNAVHQTCKLPKENWPVFLDWLYDFEFNKIQIPAPDKVIFLDMPPEISQKLLSDRYSGDNSKKDIHERDVNYLNHCREAALFTANYLNWDIINCASGNSPRTVEDINNEIFNRVIEMF